MKKMHKRSDNVVPFPSVKVGVPHLDGWKELQDYFSKLRDKDEWDWKGKGDTDGE